MPAESSNCDFCPVDEEILKKITGSFNKG